MPSRDDALVGRFDKPMPECRHRSHSLKSRGRLAFPRRENMTGARAFAVEQER